MCNTYTWMRSGHQAAPAGWLDSKGSHLNFTHPTKPGVVTVPHPRRDIMIDTLRSIYRQAGWDWRDR